MNVGTGRRERLALALARLRALRLVFASGMVPPIPVPESFVLALHDTVSEFTDSCPVECGPLRVSEKELLRLRVGRRGLWRAAVYERFVEWRTFVTKLTAALLYCEFLWSELNDDEEVRHSGIGFIRGGSSENQATAQR